MGLSERGVLGEYPWDVVTDRYFTHTCSDPLLGNQGTAPSCPAPLLLSIPSLRQLL